VLPTMPHLAERVRAGVAGWAVKPRITTEPSEKWAAFRSARAALAASGTVTLELALAGVPTVAAYRVTFIEEIIARLARIKQRLASVILANLVLGENIVPEFLQHDCTPERLAKALVPLLSDTPEWRRQVEAFARLDDIMALKTMPSAEAAAVVVDAARIGREPHGWLPPSN
jgi:lipid-A-disaccharide synthase